MPTVPTGRSGLLCSPTTADTLLSAPLAMTLPAPVAFSSAGWNSRRTVPGSSASRSLSRSAAPIAAAVWKSWPQACILPGCSEAYGNPVSSWIGSASISARTATTGPSRRPPISAMRPVRSGYSSAIRMPAACSHPRMRRVVSTSSCDSSGCRWSSLRIATSSSSSSAALSLNLSEAG
ncbi:hypothetical protein BN871_AI_01070 [Paenibacillus sp. P22]|nr:hypothetical protein BN871_AI_01070 [Paenibacillus sp. P22]